MISEITFYTTYIRNKIVSRESIKFNIFYIVLTFKIPIYR